MNCKKVKDHLGNEFISLKEMCKHYDLDIVNYYKRRNRGWSLEKILTVKLDNKALIAVVERRLKTGKTLKEIMNTEELKKTNPWILIDYYEGKIKFA